MPRFAILEHDHPTLHWDLLLEAGPALHTWRLAATPAAGVVIDAVRIGEHRLLYLDYEGPIGGDRGSVTCWDRGEFAWEENAGQRIVVRLHGKRFDGLCRLERQGDTLWLANFELC